MAITDTDLNELLTAIRAGGDIDVVRQGVALMLQALIDAEATARIGADRFEWSSTRTTQRNGTRDRLLSTKAGDVELKIPKLRQGSFLMLTPVGVWMGRAGASDHHWPLIEAEPAGLGIQAIANWRHPPGRRVGVRDQSQRCRRTRPEDPFRLEFDAHRAGSGSR